MSATSANAIHDTVNRIVCERRTVHDFAPEPVPESVLEQALEVARWAPNHHRTEPWRVYLLGSEAQTAIAKLNAAGVRETRGERAAEVKLARWMAVPGWFVMTTPVNDDSLREREDYAACCCVAQNLMLSLWAAGVGVKWTTGAVVRERKFAEIVGFELSGEQTVGLFWYGWPATVVEQHRRPVSDFLVRVD
jgi:nitroreductase